MRYSRDLLALSFLLPCFTKHGSITKKWIQLGVEYYFYCGTGENIFIKSISFNADIDTSVFFDDVFGQFSLEQN